MIIIQSLLVCNPISGAEVDAGDLPEVWLVNSVAQAYDTEPQVALFPAGDLTKSYAHW